MSTAATSVLGRLLTDVMLERYVEWHEECGAVQSAYAGWAASGVGDRTLTYAFYLAALDREEQAARTYALQVSLVARALGKSDSSL